MVTCEHSGRAYPLIAAIILLVVAAGECSGHKTFTQRKGLTGDIAQAVAGNADTLWVYTFYQIPVGSGFEVIGGVSEYKDAGNWTTYDVDDGLVSDIVFDIAIDGATVWFGTINGASMFNKDTGTWFTLKPNDGLVSNEVRAIAIGAGKVWLGTDGGVTSYDKATRELRNFTEENGLIFRYISDAAVDGDKVYFATSMGVGVFDSVSGEWSSITTKEGLSSNTVNSIVVAMDSIWFGTETGVSRLLRSGEWEYYAEEEGLPTPGITTMVASEDTIWFVTKEGIARYKPEKGKWKVIDKGLPSEDVNDAAYGKDYLWLATRKGLIRVGGRIPLMYVLISGLAVVLIAVATVKVRPILKEKAEKAKGRTRKVSGPPPWRRCKGTPSDKLCPLCKYNELKGGNPFCRRYGKRISY